MILLGKSRVLEVFGIVLNVFQTFCAQLRLEAFVKLDVARIVFIIPIEYEHSLRPHLRANIWHQQREHPQQAHKLDRNDRQFCSWGIFTRTHRKSSVYKLNFKANWICREDPDSPVGNRVLVIWPKLGVPTTMPGGPKFA